MQLWSRFLWFGPHFSYALHKVKHVHTNAHVWHNTVISIVSHYSTDLKVSVIYWKHINAPAKAERLVILSTKQCIIWNTWRKKSAWQMFYEKRNVFNTFVYTCLMVREHSANMSLFNKDQKLTLRNEWSLFPPLGERFWLYFSLMECRPEWGSPGTQEPL